MGGWHGALPQGMPFDANRCAAYITHRDDTGICDTEVGRWQGVVHWDASTICMVDAGLIRAWVGLPTSIIGTIWKQLCSVSSGHEPVASPVLCSYHSSLHLCVC
jgi:hypothetical protein